MNYKQRFIYFDTNKKKVFFFHLLYFFLLDIGLQFFAKIFNIHIVLFPFIFTSMIAHAFTFLVGFALTFFVFAYEFSLFFLRFKWLFLITLILYSLSRWAYSRKHMPVITYLLFIVFCLLIDHDVSWNMLLYSAALNATLLNICSRYIAYYA